MVPWESYWELMIVKLQHNTAAYDAFIEACDDHIIANPNDLNENWINTQLDKIAAKEDRLRATGNYDQLLQRRIR